MNLRRARACPAVLAVLAVTAAVALSTPAVAATARPTVTSLSRTSGPASGGTRVVVHGAGFVHVSAVRFGAVAVTGKQFSVESAHRLVVIAPAHHAETVHVRVVTSAGMSAEHHIDQYRFLPAPEVDSVAPDGGLPAGSTRVTVRGANFTGPTAVEFGKAHGAAIHVLTSHKLEVTSPAHSTGVIHIRVITPRGASPATAADEFTYGDAPDPVSDLAVADTSTTSATLRWTASPSAGVASVMIRRAAGSVAPDSPGAGTQVAVVPSAEAHYLDANLEPGSGYAYAVFAATAAGPLYSSPATIDVSTPAAPEITDLTIDGRPETGSACSGAYGFITPYYPFALSAQVPLPGGTSEVQAQFTLWDLGASGAEARAYVVGPADPIGLATHVRELHGSATVWLGDTALTDGHLYGVQVDATDGGAFNASSGPCHFWYDDGHPTAPTITPSKTTVHVGEHMHFTFTTTDPAPADGGRASGIDHLTYSWSSGAELAGDGGTHLPVTVDKQGLATASLKFVPGVWGTHVLYVEAHDAAGNVSGVVYYSVYVQDA
jgi:hypothetical protein